MSEEKEKLYLLQQPLIEQIVMDALHKRRSKYSAADNAGQHSDYKEMIEDLKKDYRSKIEKEKQNEK